MNYFDIAIIIIGECYVLLFSMLFNVLPGKKYYEKHMDNIQLLLSFIAMFLSVTLIGYMNNTIMRPEEKDKATPIIFLCALLFASSIYKHWNGKKNADKSLIISLKKEDYEIRKDFEFLLGDYVLMPNVSSYAKVGEDVILFRAVMPPESSVDADFSCIKLNDKTYECVSYEAKNQKLSFKMLVNRITNYVLLGLSFAEVYIVGTLASSGYSSLNEFFMKVLRLNFFLIIFGGLGAKLFKSVSGIGSKILYLFGVFLVLCGILGIILRNY